MKAVLTVAGLGTRLLPLTKELPKEMLPIFVKTQDGQLIMKPILQVIFESLYGYNIRDFCFIVGKTKRSVQEHFTQDFDLIQHLRTTKKIRLAKILNEMGCNDQYINMVCQWNDQKLSKTFSHLLKYHLYDYLIY